MVYNDHENIKEMEVNNVKLEYYKKNSWAFKRSEKASQRRTT